MFYSAIACFCIFSETSNFLFVKFCRSCLGELTRTGFLFWKRFKLPFFFFFSILHFSGLHFHGISKLSLCVGPAHPNSLIKRRARAQTHGHFHLSWRRTGFDLLPGLSRGPSACPGVVPCFAPLLVALMSSVNEQRTAFGGSMWGPCIGSSRRSQWGRLPRGTLCCS